MIDLSVKIGGEAGFGIMTTGLLMGKIATRSGYFAFEYPEYPSLIRGGHNVVSIRISDEQVFSQEEKTDILICLNEETHKLHSSLVKDGGVIVLDRDKINITPSSQNNKANYIHVPFSKILQENSLSTVMLNNIALGALMSLLDATLDVLDGLIAENFARKSQEIIDKNINAAKLGFEAVKTAYPQGYNIKIPKKTDITEKLYLTGNEMIGVGAIASLCRFYVAYPMTPSSVLLHFLAAKSESQGIVVKHAEDEISVINMALGASFAGVRSMVGTSGGGFALMVEGVSLAGITETPIVIMMGQRPGPATGMPTWTEQGDLLFILHAGHGEFPKIVLAPGDIEECYKLTIDAFNLADKYQTPVFILADKYILEGHQTVEKSKIQNLEYKINRGKLLSQQELAKILDYKRYLDTPDGISPRALPGQKGALFQANSYEHTQDGHTTEESIERVRQVDKRNKKYATFLSEDAKLPTLYGEKDRLLTLVSWGSMKAPILQAMKESGKFNYLHFSCMWPLPEGQVKEMLLSFKNILLVENNSTAQLGQLIKMVTGIDIKNKLLKYSGRPIYPEEILVKVKQLI